MSEVAPKKKRLISSMAKRSLFYAISIFAVFQLALIPLQSYSYGFFWAISAVGLVIVLAELLFSSVREYRKQISFDILHIRKKFKWEQIIHHMVLPNLLFISGVLFLFFNRVRLMDQVAIVILTASFFALYHNISATYAKMYTVTKSTTYIFSFLNIIIFYFGLDSLLNAVIYEGWGTYLVAVGAALLSLTLFGLSIKIERQFSKQSILALAVSVLIIGGITLLVVLVPLFNVGVTSLVVTVFFYLVNSYWHHKLDGTFSWGVMQQYGLFAIMALILLLYL